MKKIHVFKNADKDPVYEPHDLDNLANHRRSSRIILAGPPDSGKSNIAKNLICNQFPPWDEIYIFHIDNTTKEYNDVGVKIETSIDDLPQINELEPGKKILILFEDCDFSHGSMSKSNLSKISKYLRYACTHKGLGCIICAQDYFSIPINLRRKANVFYFFQQDAITQEIISRHLPFSAAKIKKLFNEYLSKPFDSICFDNSGHPIKLRHNTFIPIDL